MQSNFTETISACENSKQGNGTCLELRSSSCSLGRSVLQISGPDSQLQQNPGDPFSFSWAIPTEVTPMRGKEKQRYIYLFLCRTESIYFFVEQKCKCCSLKSHKKEWKKCLELELTAHRAVQLQITEQNLGQKNHFHILILKAKWTQVVWINKEAK